MWSWTPNILASGTLPIAIDLGSMGARLLQLRSSRRGLHILAAARVESVAATSEPTPERLDELAAAIQRKVSAGGFRGSRCVLSIDDRWLRVRSVRHPRMSEAELDSVIRLDAASRLGFPEDDTPEIGWLLAGEVGQGSELRDELIVMGASSQAMERVVSAFSAVGLHPVAIEPGFLANARAFNRTLRRADDRARAKLIVDVGWTTTKVIIIRGQEIAFYKSIEVGGKQMAAKASERLGLSAETIADLRRRRFEGDTSIDPRVDRAIFEAARPIIDDIAQEVALCLRYYSVTFRGVRPDECVLVGGEAREPRFAELIAGVLQIEAALGRPFHGLDAAEAVGLTDRRSLGAEWSVATGLALRYAEKPSKHPRSARSGRRADVPRPTASAAQREAA